MLEDQGESASLTLVADLYSLSIIYIPMMPTIKPTPAKPRPEYNPDSSCPPLDTVNILDLIRPITKRDAPEVVKNTPSQNFVCLTLSPDSHD